MKQFNKPIQKIKQRDQEQHQERLMNILGAIEKSLTLLAQYWKLTNLIVYQKLFSSNIYNPSNLDFYLNTNNAC